MVVPQQKAGAHRVPAVPLFVAPDVLHLILMPTEQCNFRCVYCYEEFAHGRMGRPVIEGIRRLLDERAASLRALTLEWFGGEPLLALSVIREIQEHLQSLADAHRSLRIRSGMTTNGYLLMPEILDELVGLGVRSYQITLDGGRIMHDHRRVRADGRGTFDRIWSNLLAARRSELSFQVRLRVHVDRENRGELQAFLELLGSEFGGDTRFEVFLRPLARLGGDRDCEIRVLEDESRGIIEELRQLAVRRGLRLSVLSQPDACYAAAANSFVIRATGEIAKCTVALRHSNNHIGHLCSDGTASLDNEKINGWVRGLLNGDHEALRCPMKGFADSKDEV